MWTVWCSGSVIFRPAAHVYLDRTLPSEILRAVLLGLREFNGDTDHVHLLVHYPPAVSLSKLVNSLKGVSARYLRQEHRSHLSRYLCGGHPWTPSYYAGSCDDAPLQVVKEYIEKQKHPTR